MSTPYCDRSKCSLHRWGAVWTVLLATCLLGAAPASRGSADDADEPIRFNRVFAPIDRIDDWPRGDGRYIPMHADAFEALLAGSRETDAEHEPKIVAADYRARFDGETLLRGKASFQVEHHGTSDQLLSLGQCDWAIGKAVWIGDKPETAVLGLAADGDLKLLATRSGQLEIDWSLVGQRDEMGGVEFAVRLPHRLDAIALDLPRDLAPSVDQGLITPVSEEDDRRTWRVELGRRREVVLRLARAEDAAPVGSLPQARQTMVYKFSPRGIELTAELELDVPSRGPRILALSLDTPLRLVRVQCGEQSLPWSSVVDATDRLARVTVDLPKATPGTVQTIRLGALAPLSLDEPWRLPRIQPQDVFWQEGHATLLVPMPLRIERIEGVHCRQSKGGPLSAPLVGESIELQYFAADATANIILTHPKAPLQVDWGATLELSGGGITCRMIAAFASPDRERFEIEANLATRWVIDSVDSTPTGAVADWNVQDASDNTRRLVIRLSKALSPTHGPVYLSILARRLDSPLGRAVTVEELTPLEFADANLDRRLFSVRAGEQYQMSVAGDEQLAKLDPSHLDGKDLRLLAEPPRNLLFTKDAGADHLRMNLRKRDPGYAGLIEVEATVGDKTLSESYRLQCSPDSSRLDHVVVHFSHDRPGSLRWTFGAEEAQPLAARRLPPAEQAALGYSEGQSWEVALVPARSTAFEIRATRTTDLHDEMPICLATLPEASSQEATVVIRSAEATDVHIRSSHLEPIPVEPAAPRRNQTVRAAFRYHPPQGAATAADLTILATASAETPAALVWASHLDSRFEPDGTARHVAAYWLQNSGRRLLEVTLPDDALRKDIRGVWIDDAPAPSRYTENEASAVLSIELPSGVKFPMVVIEYETNRPRWVVAQRLAPTLPEVDVPVLARYWTCWLPPGYEVLAVDKPHGASSMAWTQRLFGPLGRTAHQHLFDPWRADHWATVVPLRSKQRDAATKARQLHELLGGRVFQHDILPDAGPLPWGTLVSDDGIDAMELRMLIDSRALAQRGVVARSPVPRNLSGGTAGRGLDLLQRAQLALLVRRDIAVLTTARNAALWQSQLEPLGSRLLWRVVDGPLAERIENAADPVAAEETLVSAQAWMALPPNLPSPWIVPELCDPGAVDMRGWNAYEIEMASGTPPRVTVARSAALRGLRWVAMLLAVAVGWWRAANRPLRLAIAATVAALVALFAPSLIAVAASGAMLGLLFCLGFRLIRRGERTPTRPSESLSAAALSATSTRAVVSSLWLLAALMAVSPLRAEAPDQRPPEYQVFVPVDKDGQPVDERVFVPERLHQELEQLATGFDTGARGWLIEDAVYRGTLAATTGTRHLVVDELTASYNVRVVGPGTTELTIPLHRDEFAPAADGVTLDGRVVPLRWTEQGDSLVVVLPRRGAYRIEIVGRPMPVAPQPPINGALAPSEAQRSIKMAIPRLVRSRLELSLPANAPAVEVPTARGAVKVDNQRLVAELGPADQLYIYWRDDGLRGGAEPVAEVEELLWLKIAPGSVVLDVRWRLRVIQGRVGELSLSADPQLRLLEISPTAEIGETAASPRSRRIALAEPCSDQVTIAARFLLQNSAGVGNLRLPLLHVSSVRTSRRWFAVSVDRDLKHEIVAATLPAVAIPDFLSAWGPADPAPQFAHQLDAAAPDWSISTRPWPPRTLVDQSLRVSFGEQTSDVHFSAELTTTSGYGFSYRIEAPAALDVDRVVMLEEGLDRVARWSREATGAINVFLTGPVAGDRTLLLEGRVPTPPTGEVELPELQIDGGQVRWFDIALFRKPSVLVDVVRTQGLAEAESIVASEANIDLGRPFRAYTRDGQAPVVAAFRLHANRPRIDVEQTTIVRHSDNGYRADLEFDIRAAEGVLDEILLEIPPDMSDPIELSPTVSWRTVHFSGGGRMWAIRPHVPITDAFDFQVSCLLSGESVRVPDISIHQADADRRLVVLPLQSETAPWRWETHNLRQLPPSEGDPDSDLEDVTVYEVVGNPFEAVLAPNEQPDGPSRVRLADVRIAWREDRTYHGVASFDLEPAGNASCPLDLPEGCRLVYVAVGDVPTAPIPSPNAPSSETSGSRRYRIPMGPRSLPQRIDVVFSGRMPEGLSTVQPTLDVPRPGNLPVVRTLWTVSGPSGLEPIGEDESLRQEQLRVENLVAMLDHVAKSHAKQPELARRWYRSWDRRLTAHGDALRRSIAQHAGDSAVTAAQETLDHLERRRQQWIGMTGLVHATTSDPPADEEPSALWRRSLDSHGSMKRWVIDGGLEPIRLTYQSVGIPWRERRLGVAMVLIAALGMLRSTSVRRLLATMVWKWPQLVGVLLGLAWWLWLWPSVLGWVIVLVCLLSTLRSGWQRPHEPDSAIVRLG